MGPAIAMKMACCGSVKVIECPPPPDLYVVVFFCSYLPALLEFGAPAAAVRDSRNTSAGLPVTAPAPVFEAKKAPRAPTWLRARLAAAKSGIPMHRPDRIGCLRVLTRTRPCRCRNNAIPALDSQGNTRHADVTVGGSRTELSLKGNAPVLPAFKGAAREGVRRPFQAGSGCPLPIRNSFLPFDKPRVMNRRTAMCRMKLFFHS